MKKRIIAASAVCLGSALIAWVGGYDFDTRGVIEALWAGMTIVFAVIAARLPWNWEEL